MTATAPPPGTMARRAIPQTAVPAMTAPGQPTALRGPDALPRTLRPSLPACRAMPPGVLPGHSRRGTRPLPTVPGTRKGLGPAGRALSAGQRQTHRHREPGHLSPVVPLRCPYPRLRHFAHAHRAGRPGSGTAADAPSPRTRAPFPSRPAAVPIPPLAALRPCSPCRTARQRDRPQRRCLRHQRPLSPPRGQGPRQRTGRPPRPPAAARCPPDVPGRPCRCVRAGPLPPQRPAAPARDTGP